MNKFFLLAAGLLTAGAMSAQMTFTELPGRELVPQVTGVTECTTVTTPQRTIPRGEIPANIIGKKYNTFYSSFSNYRECTGYFIVEAGTGDTVVLKGIADGYDLKGLYDKGSGTVTVPSGQVVGTHASLGTITVYTFLAPGFTQYSTAQPCVLSFVDNRVIFDNGFYGAVSAGGIVNMRAVSGIESNGSLSLNRTNQAGTVTASYEYPVYISNATKSEFEVQGISTFMYKHNYQVPFHMNSEYNIAILLTTDSVDWYYSSSATPNTQCFFMLAYNGANISQNPNFSIAAGDTSVIKANSRLFMGYQTSESNWSGFFLSDFVLKVHFNVYDPPKVEDATEVTINNINYALDNETLEATVTGCASTLNTLTIPNTIKANSKVYDVVAVEKAAFQGNSTIATMTIPQSIKVIKTDAFRNMSNLTQLYIEDLESWCKIYFANGNANPIYNVFPTNESRWGRVYVAGRRVTTSLTVPEGITRLSRTFYGFKTLTKVTLPSTLRTLGDQAFANCISLPTCEIPTSVDSIGSAFYGCTALESIEIPAAVKQLGGSTFYNCKALTNVTLHNGLENIKNMAFYGCTGLKELTLPSSVKEIAATAFTSDLLTTFTVLPTVPPVTMASAFSSFAPTCLLRVPEGTLDAYKAAPGWSEFVNMAIYDGVDGIDMDNDVPAVYYNVNGCRVNSNNLVPGVYIKVQGSKTTRVLVK